MHSFQSHSFRPLARGDILVPRALTRLTYCSHAVISLLTVATISCDAITEPEFPAAAVLIEPPRVYTMWWRLTEACSGVTGDFSSIRWYDVPDASQIVVAGRPEQGYWWSDGDRIVLAGQDLLAGQLVRHEMLHALIGGGHPQEYFTDKCGGVVACGGPCLTEAGDTPAPPAAALTIDVTDLSVESGIQTSDASVSTDSGWAAITVSARNPRNEPVWVSLRTVAPNEKASATFGYDFQCTSGGCGSGGEYKFVWDDKIGFAAGQTRRYVFDRKIEPGTYTFRGFFNIDTTSSTTVQSSAK
jgi:hypothetical protein